MHICVLLSNQCALLVSNPLYCLIWGFTAVIHAYLCALSASTRDLKSSRKNCKGKFICPFAFAEHRVMISHDWTKYIDEISKSLFAAKTPWLRSRRVKCGSRIRFTFKGELFGLTKHLHHFYAELCTSCHKEKTCFLQVRNPFGEASPMWLWNVSTTKKNFAVLNSWN